MRVKRGFFATIPSAFQNSAKDFLVDPYLLAGRIVQDAVIAYHSAFDFHGISYSLHHQYLYLSKKPIWGCSRIEKVSARKIFFYF